MRIQNKTSILALLSLVLLVGLLAACGSSSKAQPQFESKTNETDASQALPANAEQASESKTITLYVGSELADCTGVAPQKCMLVKENPDDEYVMFYDQIAGFEYEEGYEYELLVQVEKVENPPADASNLKYTLVEEVSKTPVDAAEVATGPSLEGVLWVLQSYANANVLPDTKITVEFQDGKLSGNTGCNRYFGAYQQDDEALEIAVGGKTTMACPEPIMAQEQAYLAALGEAATFEIADGQLTIANADGDVILTYAADQPPELVGTDWQLVSYNNDKGGLVSSSATELITAIFGEDGKLAGFSGCNNYHAAYEVDGETISIGPAATTRKMCAEPQNVMEDELGYLLALERVATFEIKDDKLTMYDEEGTRQLVYRVAGAEIAAEAVVEPATDDQPAAAATYRTLLPSDIGDALLVILTLNPDGTVKLITDHLDDPAGEGPVEQGGRWETTEDGRVTITIVADDGEETVYEFELKDGHLRALKYDVTLFGGKGLPLHEYEPTVASTAKRAFVTLDLTAGAPLDPFFVSVNGGGDLDASALGEGCKGFIHEQPVVSIDWEGDADFAEIFFFSDHDPTLVIRTPDGEYLCSDDTNPLLLDPTIEIPNPTKGEYDIWVGSYQPGQLLPGVLVLTTRPDVNIGTFSLDNLITRASVHEVLTTEIGHLEAEQFFQSVQKHQGDIVKVEAGGEPLTVEISSEGTVPAFDFTFENVQCNGFVSDFPDYVFEWTGEAEQLAIYFEGDEDSTLVVVTPGPGIACNDDAVAGDNLNPMLLISEPAEGLYAVFVGRLNQEEPVSGELTITDVASVQPEPLAPADQ